MAKKGVLFIVTVFFVVEIFLVSILFMMIQKKRSKVIATALLQDMKCEKTKYVRKVN